MTQDSLHEPVTRNSNALHFTYEKYPSAAAAACCLRWLGRAVEFSPCNRVVHSVSATRAETSRRNRPRTLLAAHCAPAGVSGDAGNLGRRNPSLKLVPGPPPSSCRAAPARRQAHIRKPWCGVYTPLITRMRRVTRVQTTHHDTQKWLVPRLGRSDECWPARTKMPYEHAEETDLVTMEK